MCISCQLSGGHKTKKHSGRYLVPFYWCFSTNSSVCSILLSFFFFYYSNLTNDRVANPFSLHLETPSISKMHKHWRVWVVNSTSTVSLSDPVERSAFLMILLFAFIEEGLHFAGFLFLRIFFLYLLFSLEWLQVGIYLTIKLITTSLFISELTRL